MELGARPKPGNAIGHECICISGCRPSSAVGQIEEKNVKPFTSLQRLQPVEYPEAYLRAAVQWHFSAESAIDVFWLERLMKGTGT
jgi:hypothetical protein